MREPVIARVNRRTTPAVIAAVVAMMAAACGGERSFDNPPEVPIGTASSTSTTTAAPTTTVFVPATAPTTLAPSTNPPPPTAAPTFAPQTAPPTQPTIPTSPVPTIGGRYTVVQGDTLFGISRKVNVRLQDLLAANGLNENSLIVPGQQLGVPQGGSVPVATPAPQPQAQPQPSAPPAATAAPTTARPAPTPTAAPAPAPTAAPAQPTTTFAAPAGGVVPRETGASCQAPDSEEADGRPIVFSPGNVLDRNPATAWRCDASASPKTLTFTFDGATHLTSVGLIGGYVKVDPLTGVDRFPQNHRVRQVRWTFDNGTTVTQDLTDSRSMQTLPVDITATTVTMEITATYPPGGEAPRAMVPVAEVQFIAG
jgi:LysM repeat protein